MLLKNRKELDYEFGKWKHKVNFENHFYSNSPLLDILTEDASIFETQIAKGTEFYRGRIFNSFDVATSQRAYDDWVNATHDAFQGYDKENCGAPPKQYATEGRLNGRGISFLYTCDKEDTVIYELRPTRGEIVSIAKFVSKKNLIFADLTRRKSDIVRRKSDMLADLLANIANEFSTPHYAGHEYYFTQYLAGQFMNLEFDGIIFESSLNPKGENIVFFYPEDCEAIDSKLYMVNGISINYSPCDRKDT